MSLLAQSDVVALLTGHFLNVFLHGTLTIQVYDYHIDYPNDRRCFKSLVYGIYIVENVQLFLMLYHAYVMFTGITSVSEHYGQTTGALAMVIGVIIAATTQAFYVYRIYLLSRRVWLVAVILVLAFSHLVFGVVLVVQIILSSAMYPILALQRNLLISLYCNAALCDIIISVTMVTLLVQSFTELASTHRLIKRVMSLTIGTGFITAGATIICLVLIISFPNNLQLSIVSLSLEKWYSNSLLAQLNSRDKKSDSDILSEPPAEEVEFCFAMSSPGPSVSTADDENRPSRRKPFARKRCVDESMTSSVTNE